VNIWQSYRQGGCFTRSVHLSTVLHKDEEFAIDFTYNMKTVLLTVVTLVSPLILTFKKGKGFPYSIPSIGPGADPGVQAVSPQVTVSHTPGGRLPLLSARPVVTSPASEHHRPLAGTKLYCLVTEAHRCKQLAQGCYTASP